VISVIIVKNNKMALQGDIKFTKTIDHPDGETEMLTIQVPEDVDNHLIDPIRYVALYLQAKRVIKII